MNKKAKRAIIISASVVLFLALVLAFFVIGERVALGFERYVPGYEKIELSEILEKGALTDEDYAILYKQTGLTKEGIDSVIAKDGYDGIYEIQDEFFKSYEIVDENFAPFCHYYEVEVPKNDLLNLVPLQKGDIIISTSTEFSWWTVGHCAMVIDSNQVIEVNGVGDTSSITSWGLYSIKRRGNFMVLRPNLDEATINAIIEYTKNELVDIPYDPTIGVLSRKYNPEIPVSQCSHLVWFAFYQFGIDLDSNGGTIVTPKDIANSRYLRLVQVSGFDPVNLLN